MPEPATSINRLSHDLAYALISLDRLGARKILIESRHPFGSFEKIEQIIVPALERIGAGWEQGTIALSQVYMSGRICEELVDEILPPGDPQRKKQPPMAIVTLEDYHSLGKRIVYSALRAAGYDLQDYGHGVLADDLVARTRNDKIHILLISTLMLNAALHVKEVTRQLAAARRGTKVIVGGAPFLFDPQLWREVDADAMGRHASDAIKLVREMLGGGA